MAEDPRTKPAPARRRSCLSGRPIARLWIPFGEMARENSRPAVPRRRTAANRDSSFSARLGRTLRGAFGEHPAGWGDLGRTDHLSPFKIRKQPLRGKPARLGPLAPNGADT